MKKTVLMILAAALLCCASVCAQETDKKDDSKWASITYSTVPILKVLEGKDGYVVIYQKNSFGVGSTVVPKKWANGSVDNPRKLKFRSITGNLQPFMTIVKKDNKFLRVIISIPLSKNNSVWGLADYHQKLDGTDKDSLEDLEM